MKVIYNDGHVAECPEDEELHVIRHTAAHILAQAVKRLYPEARFAYGPATEKGFYYDVDLGDKKLSDEDLPAIEAEMAKIVKENLPIKPFVLSREDAVQRLKQHYKGKVFLPKSFSSENHLQEISGVYVPFWMFSGEAEGDAHFDATRSRTYKSGDYRITETDHYDAYRAGSLAFEKIPVDGSEKMPDEHMDSIEPYDYSELKPFSTAYLPGFLADKFDVTAEDSRQRADSRCAGTLRSALEKTVSGYETCSARESNTTIKRGKVHYALMPVWMLNTKWRGKDFLFAMNGQTGKFVGNLPADKNAARRMTIKLTVIFTMIFYILRLILWMFGI
mgnify:CR=1 FL=1